MLAACLLLTGLLLAAVHQAGRAAAAPSPYLLPYPAGLAVQVTQGNAAGDHSAENQSEYAFDFGAGGAQFPVLAARAGIVHGEQHTSSGPCRPFGCWQQGNYVLIDHGDGTSALYLHLAENQVYVHTGDHVVQGQRIGLADDTGFSAGSHLHLQVGETPCPRPDPQTRTPCEDRPGWWWPPSTPTWFADRDVVARAPGGVPQADVSYASDNVEPGQSPGGGPSTAPPDDWDDHSYTVTCDGLVPQGFRATLRNGNATVFGSDVGSSDYTTFQVTDEATARGDVTGDGAPETVVLLSCTPQPSNYFVQEVQVFGPDGALLAELPSPATLQEPGTALPPLYDTDRPFGFRGGDLVAPMLFYAPTDSHASGPSIARTVRWHWTGSQFVRVR